MNEFDQAPRQDRDLVQAAYGAVMLKMFQGFVALHRFDRIIKLAGADDYGQERAAKAEAQKKRMLDMLGPALRELGPEDVSRCKAFSAALVHADLSSRDEVVIENVLRKLRS